ncbi:MAG: type II toxin-antitoxin system ParD family antitoxin [Candidatus Sumerlaeota bacterium]|nr:type II toxin-antitoxin system ParD family antitoxin [Candidatus Sumerlaeota bacterium]
MNLALAPELEDIIQHRIDSGLYSTPSEVLREALYLMEERDVLIEKQRLWLRRELQAGIAQLDAGEYCTPTAEDIKNHIRQRLKQNQ